MVSNKKVIPEHKLRKAKTQKLLNNKRFYANYPLFTAHRSGLTHNFGRDGTPFDRFRCHAVRRPCSTCSGASVLWVTKEKKELNKSSLALANALPLIYYATSNELKSTEINARVKASDRIRLSNRHWSILQPLHRYFLKSSIVDFVSDETPLSIIVVGYWQMVCIT